MGFARFDRFARTERFRASGSGVRRILQPIALTSPDGIVFVTAEGAVLVRGTRRVTLLTPQTSPVIEFASADGAFFASADGNIFSAGAA
jgi:hypothetical protein